MNVVNDSSKTRSLFKPLVARPNSDMRLLCFPYAGGSAAIFRRWADIAVEIEFVGAQYRGRASRMHEYLYRSVSEFVGESLANIKNFCNKPYAIFGHSMGAMVAFDLTKKLADNSAHTPVHLFLSGLASPWMRVAGKQIYDLPDHDFLCEIKKLGGIPSDILENSDILEILIPAIRADLEAAHHWRIDKCCDLGIPVTIFGGADDTGIPLEALADWASFTSMDIEINLHPGNHFFIHHEFPAIIDSIRHHLFKTKRQSFHENSICDVLIFREVKSGFDIPALGLLEE